MIIGDGAMEIIPFPEHKKAKNMSFLIFLTFQMRAKVFDVLLSQMQVIDLYLIFLWKITFLTCNKVSFILSKY